jgi:hypothetical protein
MSPHIILTCTFPMWKPRNNIDLQIAQYMESSCGLRGNDEHYFLGSCETLFCEDERVISTIHGLRGSRTRVIASFISSVQLHGIDQWENGF